MSNAENNTWGIPPSGMLRDATAVVAWPVVAVEAECRADVPTDALSRLVARLVGAGESGPDAIAGVSGLSAELVQVVLDHLQLARRVSRDRDVYTLTAEGEAVASGEDVPAPERLAWFLVCARTSKILPVRYWEELPSNMRWSAAVLVDDPGTHIDPNDPVFGARLRAVASWCDEADAFRAGEGGAEPPPAFGGFVDQSEGWVAMPTTPQPASGGDDLGDANDAEATDVATTGRVKRAHVLLGLSAGDRPGELRVTCPWPGDDDRFFVERLVGLPQPEVSDLCDRLLQQSDRHAASETVRLAAEALRAQLETTTFPWGALSALPDRLRAEVEVAEAAWFRLHSASERPHEVVGAYRKVFEVLLALALPAGSEAARDAVRRIPRDGHARGDWIRGARLRWPLNSDEVGKAAHGLSKAGEWAQVKPYVRHGQKLIALLAAALELAPDLVSQAVRPRAGDLTTFVNELATILTALNKGGHASSCQVEDAASSREQVQELIAAFYPGADHG